MVTRIIKIGNSRGVRIPKPLLEQTGLENEVELKVQDNQIVIGPIENPRQGWEEAFQEMARQGDDQLLDSASATQWDEEEWQW
jgi:antitoxin MazE